MTDQTYVFVKGAKTAEDAVQKVKDDGCNCPRIYGNGRIDAVKSI